MDVEGGLLDYGRCPDSESLFPSPDAHLLLCPPCAFMAIAALTYLAGLAGDRWCRDLFPHVRDEDFEHA